MFNRKSTELVRCNGWDPVYSGLKRIRNLSARRVNIMRALIVKTSQILALIAIVCIFAQPSSAAVSIGDLIADQGSFISSGDKLFDNFSFSSTGEMPDADEVLIEPFVDESDNFGIRLVSSFLDFGGGGASELRLSYRVTATDPKQRISGAKMAGDLTVPGTGSFVGIETIGTVPAELGIFVFNPGPSGLTDAGDFGSLFTSVEVDLHLTAEATADGEENAVSATVIEQSFVQSVVPEPASIAVWAGMLLLIGGVPYVCRRAAPEIK